MIKWCLCVTEDRDICEPKFFDTYAEAYQNMKKLLVGNIADSSHADEHLDDNGEIINVGESEQHGRFYISRENPISEHDTMWSNLNDDYSLDAAIFKVNIK